MGLIDWSSVARGILWVSGLSIVLATCSYASWRSAQQRVSLRKMLSRAAYQVTAATGFLLFSAGLAWDASRPWERLAWAVLALAFVGWIIAGWSTMRSQDEHQGGTS